MKDPIEKQPQVVGGYEDDVVVSQSGIVLVPEVGFVRSDATGGSFVAQPRRLIPSYMSLSDPTDGNARLRTIVNKIGTVE
jgi:hypothetical protein